jgi:hypothetical protein
MIQTVVWEDHEAQALELHINQLSSRKTSTSIADILGKWTSGDADFSITLVHPSTPDTEPDTIDQSVVGVAEIRMSNIKCQHYWAQMLSWWAQDQRMCHVILYTDGTSRFVPSTPSVLNDYMLAYVWGQTLCNATCCLCHRRTPVYTGVLLHSGNIRTDDHELWRLGCTDFTEL